MKNKKVKQKKGARRRRMHCPYCGSPVIYRTADGIYKENTKRAMLFVCSRYPSCNAYVRANKVTKKPIGTLADPSLRRLRNQAHRFFNRLYESGLMSKGEAYNWLSVLTGMPENMAHIGFMGEYNCRLIIDESKRLLKSQHISYWRGGENDMTLTEDQRGQVEANMGLIGKVLKDKLRGSSALGIYIHEDLFQIGCVGLCKAVAEDKKTGCFSTFAYRLIWNEICDALVLGNRYAMHEAPTEDLSDTHPTASEFASSNSRLELEELQRRLSRDAPAGIRKGMQVLILKAHGYTSKEIGVQLQLPANAVRTLASRTRAYIRKLPEYAAYVEGGLV